MPNILQLKLPTNLKFSIPTPTDLPDREGTLSGLYAAFLNRLLCSLVLFLLLATTPSVQPLVCP